MNTRNFLALTLLLFSCVVKHASSSSSSIGAGLPSLGNPCVSICDDANGGTADLSSRACATCCRTVAHEIPWNCDLFEEEAYEQEEEVEERWLASSAAVAPWLPSFLATIAQSHENDAVAASCAGDWQTEWWNVPSADNFGHACSMCCGPCSDSFNGCGSCAQTGDCGCGGCSGGVCKERRSFMDVVGPLGLIFIFIAVLACSAGGITIYCCYRGIQWLWRRCLNQQQQQQQQSNTDTSPKPEVVEKGSC